MFAAVLVWKQVCPADRGITVSCIWGDDAGDGGVVRVFVCAETLQTVSTADVSLLN